MKGILIIESCHVARSALALLASSRTVAELRPPAPDPVVIGFDMATGPDISVLLSASKEYEAPAGELEGNQNRKEYGMSLRRRARR